jgi:hypothetical protein
MTKPYGYGKPVRSFYQALFRRYLYVFLALALIIAAAAVFLVRDVTRSGSDNNHPVSRLETRTIGGSASYKTNFFQFRDSGKWSLNDKESTANKFVYYKYHGLETLRQLVIYVNQTPPPLELAATRVLPTHIINGQTLDPVNVSPTCTGAYSAGQLHQVKEVTFSGTTILCNPDSPRYVVVVGEVGGNYRLKLLRGDKSSADYVIIYRDLTLDPGPDTLKNIVSSFQAI